MADQYIGEIRIFAGNFAPRGWALCNGQLMPIAQNTALFSLLGTRYGGDGKTTFALPNLQGRAAMHWGNGPGLTERALGENGGTPGVTLLTSEMPAHSHVPMGAASANAVATTNSVWAGAGRGGGNLYTSAPPNTQMSVQALQPNGQGMPHNNMQPYQVLNFIIALEGYFPPRD